MDQVVQALAGRTFINSIYDRQFAGWLQTTIDTQEDNGRETLQLIESHCTQGQLALRPLSVPKTAFHVLVGPILYEAIEARTKEMLKNVEAFVQAAVGEELHYAFGDKDEQEITIFLDDSPTRRYLVEELRQAGFDLRDFAELEFWLQKVGFNPNKKGPGTLWRRATKKEAGNA